MNLRLVDDYGGAGFGGYYAIEVSEDDDWYGDEFLGERDCPAAQAVAQLGAPRLGQVFAWTSKRKAKKALTAAKRAVKEACRDVH